MTVDIARLGLAIDSTQAAQAAKKLDDMTKAGAGAERQTDRLRTASQRLQAGVERLVAPLRGVYNQLFSLRGLMASLGIGLLAKGFLDAARETENYRVRLRTLLGSVGEGNVLFKQLTELASRVPQQYREIMGAATTLSTVIRTGAGDITKWTEITADLAAAFGMTVEDTAQNMVKALSAGASAADTFRERGVNAFLGFRAGVSYTAEETRKRIIEEWEKVGSKFRGATAELAKTWDGTVSMLGDKWFQFRVAVMDSAPFDFLKAALQLLDESIGTSFNEIKAHGQEVGRGVVETFTKIVIGAAGVVETVLPVFQSLWDALGRFSKFYNDLPQWVKEVGVIGAILLGPKLTLAIAAVSGLADKLSDQFAAMWRDFETKYAQTRADLRSLLTLPDDRGNRSVSLSLIEKEPDPNTLPVSGGSLFGSAGANGLQDRVRGAMDAVLTRMRKLQADVAAAAADTSTGGGSGGGSRALEPLIKINDELDRQVGLLRLTADARADAAKLHQLEEQLRKANVTLGAAERSQLAERIAQLRELNDVVSRQDSIYRDIKGPMEDHAKNLKALNNLYAAGRIEQVEYAKAAGGLRIAFLESQTDLASGYERGFLKMQRDVEDFSKISERLVVNGFNGMEDAIVRFSHTGKLSFSDMADSIIADLIRIQVRQAITMPLVNAVSEAGGPSGLWGSIATYFGGGGASSLPNIQYQTQADFLHGGGIAGRAGRSVTVPTSAFAGARRFHEGGMIGADEQPAILRKGEGVFTPEQMAAMGRAEVNVTVINNSGEPVEREERDNGRGGQDIILTIGRQVAKDIRGGGPVHKAILSSFSGIRAKTEGR